MIAFRCLFNRREAGSPPSICICCRLVKVVWRQQPLKLLRAIIDRRYHSVETVCKMSDFDEDGLPNNRVLLCIIMVMVVPGVLLFREVLTQGGLSSSAIALLVIFISPFLLPILRAYNVIKVGPLEFGPKDGPVNIIQPHIEEGIVSKRFGELKPAEQRIIRTFYLAKVNHAVDLSRWGFLVPAYDPHYREYLSGMVSLMRDGIVGLGANGLLGLTDSGRAYVIKQESIGDGPAWTKFAPLDSH